MISSLYCLSLQWVQCDLRHFEMAVLGKFSVVMADPPWDIHMELPYGVFTFDTCPHSNVVVTSLKHVCYCFDLHFRYNE